MSRANSHLAALQPYEPGKPIDELRRELGVAKIVKLASNENPYGPSKRALDALANTTDLHLYPDPTAFALRAAIAEHHGVSMAQVCLGNGSNELIDMLVRVFCGEGDHVVFGDPSFLCYRIACIAADVPFTAVPLVEHLHWSVDDLLDAVTPQTKMLFIANPNNPTGAYIGQASLDKLLDRLPPSVLAVVDEAYVEFADTQDYVSALERQRDNVVVLRTFSKAYGLAALRVGYAIASDAIVADLNRLRAPFNVNVVAQRAALAALADPDHVAMTVRSNTAERRTLGKALQERGFEVAPSQANFVLFKTEGGRELYERLLKRGVIVRAMGPPIADWVRVTVGTPDDNAFFLDALDQETQ